MTAIQIARGSRWTGPVLAILGAAALVGSVIALVVLSQTIGGSDEPPAIGPYVAPPENGITALDVKQREGARIVVTLNAGATDRTGGSADLSLAPGAKIEVLRAIQAADIQPGDQVTLIGVPNAVKNFSIRSIVVQPGATPADGQPVRSPGGFVGFEAARSRDDRALLSGTVEAIEGGALSLTTAAGPMQLRLENARLFRIEPGAADDIQEGDRLAGAFGAGQPLTALLVWPGGARQESEPAPAPEGASEGGGEGGTS